jgi:hypothetical protein
LKQNNLENSSEDSRGKGEGEGEDEGILRKGEKDKKMQDNGRKA